MDIIRNPIYVISILTLSVILAVYIGKTKTGKQFGPALIVILITAVLANFKIIPSASNSIELYDIIFKYLAPISIFYLLLNVNLNTIKNAGLPMIGLFIIGSLSTTIGILLSWKLFSPDIILGEDGRVIAGMLTGTYTGGSVNFNAVALEFEFQKKGTLYAGTIAVDNVITTLWIIITLTFPRILNTVWKNNRNFKFKNENHIEVKTKDQSIDMNSLMWLVFLGVACFYVSEIISKDFIKIPSIIVLSSLGITLAQTNFVSNLKGSHNLGLYLVYIFLAVIGAYCELSAVNELKEVGITLLIFTCFAVMLHGIILIILGGLIYRDWEMIAIVSQANIGGGTTAIALAETFNRKDLILPAILVGTLGNALGTYLGFLVIYIL